MFWSILRPKKSWKKHKMTEYLNEIAILLVYVILGIGALLDRIRDARIKRLERMMSDDLS